MGNKRKIIYGLVIVLVLGVIFSQTFFASGFQSDSQKVIAEVYNGSDAVPVTAITLSKTSMSMKSGDKVKLTAKVSPANASRKNVLWFSNNTGVAVVGKDGTVTAVGAGSTTINAVSGSALAQCTVNVASDDGVTITLSKTSLTLKVKQSQKLTATIKPAAAKGVNLVWTSSNPSVASVDANGKITAKKAGKATISVKTLKGNKTFNCTVTVK